MYVFIHMMGGTVAMQLGVQLVIGGLPARARAPVPYSWWPEGPVAPATGSHHQCVQD